MRLIDFGLALAGDKAGAVPTSDEVCGTPCYMAPEVKYAGKKGVKRYSAPADWYTLGVLIYELTEQQARLASPRRSSPRLASPRLASPRLASPRLASPRLALPCL